MTNDKRRGSIVGWTVVIACLLFLGLAPQPARAEPLPELHQEKYGISRATLSNGLEVIIVEDHGLELVTIDIAVRNGAFTEPPEFDGLSHLYEHMFFKGNSVITNEEDFNRALREIGARSNATTSQEVVKYFVTVHKKNLRKATTMLRDALFGPLFSHDELRGEMPVVLGEFDRNEADPNYHLYRETSKKLWYKYPSRKNSLGDRDVIFNVTREKMREIQRRYYVPNNSSLIIGGDVQPAEVLELAVELFGDWAPTKPPHKEWPIPAHPHLTRYDRIVVAGKVKTGTIQVAWHGPSMEKNTKDTYAADVFSYILSQPDSKFQKALVDSGMVNAANLSYSSLVHTGPIYLSASTSFDRIDAGWEAINAEIEKFNDPEYITDDQIESAKNMLEIGEIYGREKTSDFVHTLTFWWSTGGLDYYLNYIENLRKVDRNDLARYVTKYIRGKNRVEAVLVEEDYVKKLVFANTAEIIRPEVGSSASALGAQAEDTGVTTEEFDVDGLAVVARHNPNSDIVVARMLFQGGIPYAETETAGRELLLLQSLDKGSANFAKEEVNRQMARTGAGLSASAVHDYSTFALKTLRRDVDENFSIFADAIVNPLLDKTEVQLGLDRRLNAIAMREEDPDSYISILASKNFYQGHPYEVHPAGTRETMEGTRAKDLEALHKESFVRARMKLFVTGPLTKEEITELVRERFGDLPDGDFEFEYPEHNPEGPPRFLLDEREIPTNYIFGSFRVPSLADPDYAALKVAVSILSDRLYVEIRSKRNLSYAPMALVSSRHENYGVLYVTTVKPNVTLQIMYDEIDRIIAEPVSDDELRAKIEQMITGDLMGNQTGGSQIAQLILHDVNGGGWQTESQMIEKIRQVSAHQIQEAAAEYLKGFYFSAIGNAESFDRELHVSR